MVYDSTQLRILAGRLGFVLVSVISFVNAVARTGGLFTVIPILARDRLGLSADRIGAGLALASLAGLILIIFARFAPEPHRGAF